MESGRESTGVRYSEEMESGRESTGVRYSEELESGRESTVGDIVRRWRVGRNLEG